MEIFTEHRREFAAKYLSDLAKAIAAVALASYFFKEFSFKIKFFLGAIFIIFSVGSLFIHPKK